MKTANLPSIRVAPEFRATVESVLNESETLTEFVEHAVRESVLRRRNAAEFQARGIASVVTASRGVHSHHAVARAWLEAAVSAAG